MCMICRYLAGACLLFQEVSAPPHLKAQKQKCCCSPACCRDWGVFELFRKAHLLYAGNAGEIETHQDVKKSDTVSLTGRICMFCGKHVFCRHETQTPKKEARFRSAVAMFAGSHDAAASQSS